MQKSFDSVKESHKVSKLWLDGELQDAETLGIPFMTPTLHYGIGAFEGIRAYKGKNGPAVFRLDEHIHRLFESSRLLHMDVPFTEQQIAQACCDTLAACNLEEGYVRPLVFVDDGKRGLGAMNNRIRVAIIVWPWGTYLGEEGIRNGIKASVSSFQRMSSKSFYPKGKICGQYVNSVLAKREAVSAGFDEAILLDDNANVCEASGENIFMIQDGVLLTPPLSAGILAGITRASVIEIATHLGIPVKEQNIPRESLFLCDEVFLTGTAAEVTPVRQINTYTVGSGTRGPLTEKIQSAYFSAVRGELKGFEKWNRPYSMR